MYFVKIRLVYKCPRGSKELKNIDVMSIHVVCVVDLLYATATPSLEFKLFLVKSVQPGAGTQYNLTRARSTVKGSPILGLELLWNFFFLLLY